MTIAVYNKVVCGQPYSRVIKDDGHLGCVLVDLTILGHSRSMEVIKLS